MEVTSPESAQVLQSEKTTDTNVVSMAAYLAERLETLKSEIRRVEKQTGQMMNQLIREIDHSVARRLQRDIGRLDSYHADLSKRIKSVMNRHQRYVRSA